MMSVSQQRLKEIAAIPDKKIDTSDIPELDKYFWKNAAMVIPKTKQTISICLDSNIIDRP